MEAPPPWKRPEAWPFPIETERLVLTAPSHDQAQAVFQAIDANREHIIPWMPWPLSENLSVGQTHYTIERFLRDLDADPPSNVPVFIYERDTGRYIGGTGLHDFHPSTHQAETGYWISSDRCGRGLCTEAVVGLTEVAFRPQSRGGLGLRRLEIRCSADNKPSGRVAEKAGYQLEGTLRAHRWVDAIGWSDTLIFGATADTWNTP